MLAMLHHFVGLARLLEDPHGVVTTLTYEAFGVYLQAQARISFM